MWSMSIADLCDIDRIRSAVFYGLKNLVCGGLWYSGRPSCGVLWLSDGPLEWRSAAPVCVLIVFEVLMAVVQNI